MRVRRWLNNSRSILTDRKHLILFYLLESEQNVRNYASCNIQNIQLGEKTKEDFYFIINLKEQKWEY